MCVCLFEQADNQKNDILVSRYVREVIVEPMHQLGAAVWGEMYNFQRATTAKMLDGGRNTDMPDGTPGFPGELHDMVVAGDLRGLEGERRPFFLSFLIEKRMNYQDRLKTNVTES
jgi:hypothetical protein